MTPYRINLKDLVNKNRRALALGKVGAQKRGGTCQYFYEDGSRCGVGWALPRELHSVVQKSYNAASINILVNAGLLEETSAASAAILRMTQYLHDLWAINERFYITNLVAFHTLPKNLQEFIEELKNKSSRITQDIYCQWLDLIEEEIKAGRLEA